jgi:hypothetical protein
MRRLGLLVLALLVSCRAAFAQPVDPPRDPAAAQAHWRWIGIQVDIAGAPLPPCPPIAGWSRQRMFPTTTNTWLRRFCVYENPAPMAPPVKPPNLQRLDPDVMAMLPEGGALETTLWPALAQHFDSQVGRVDLPLTGGLPVRLAVVDTAATNEIDPEKHPSPLDASPHGFSIINMAKHLACSGPDGSACIAQVTSRLALRWKCFDPETNVPGCEDLHGGRYGLIGELAQAIHAEVNRSQEVHGTAPLVINLSVGWDPIYGGLEQVPDMSAPVAAVYAALEDTVCRGAMAVAAAGNREGGPTPQSGPVLPAAWEQRGGPSFARCHELGLEPNPADFVGNYRPLLFAAGGVRRNNQPLFNSRDDASPRLVSFSDHAVVEAATSDPTAILTGTSVAAVVTSVAAAAVAYYRPQWSLYGVLGAVYASGGSLGSPADFYCSGGPCTPLSVAVHRVSVCRAVAQSCSGPAGCGVTVPACPTLQPIDMSGVDLSQFTDPLFGPRVDLTAMTTAFPVSPTCHGDQILYAPPGAPTYPCPQYELNEDAPGVNTQPRSTPCVSCVLRASDGAFYVEIDSTVSGVFEDATLKCGGTAWNLGLGPLSAGEKAIVVGLDEVSAHCAGADPVEISFVTELGTNAPSSATSPVLIAP